MDARRAAMCRLPLLPGWVNICSASSTRPSTHLPIMCRAPAATAVLVKKMRQALASLLERKVRQPGLRVEEAGGELIASVVELLDREEVELKWDR